MESRAGPGDEWCSRFGDRHQPTEGEEGLSCRVVAPCTVLGLPVHVSKTPRGLSWDPWPRLRRLPCCPRCNRTSTFPLKFSPRYVGSFGPEAPLRCLVHGTFPWAPATHLVCGTFCSRALARCLVHGPFPWAPARHMVCGTFRPGGISDPGCDSHGEDEPVVTVPTVVRPVCPGGPVESGRGEREPPRRTDWDLLGHF